jgi:glucose/arabinose dehydrogenase
LDERGDVAGQEELLTDLKERIRDVRVSLDGYIYIATDAVEGRVLRIEPAP